MLRVDLQRMIGLTMSGFVVWAAAALVADEPTQPAPRASRRPQSAQTAEPQPAAPATQATGRQRNNPAAPSAPANPPNATSPNRQRPASLEAANTAVSGPIVAYEANKSITVEIRRRGGKTERMAFDIVADKVKIEVSGDVKELAVGQQATIWFNEKNPKLAARIAVGQNTSPRRPGNSPTTPPPAMLVARNDSPAAKFELPKKPLRPSVAGLLPRDVARQIDEQIDAGLAKAKLKAGPLCDDAEFVRRVYLDITGVLPASTDVAAFLDSRDADKRAQLIERLLASPDYGRHFADIWCERIVSRDLAVSKTPFTQWLADSWNEGRGWDEIVFQLLTADGGFRMAGRGTRMYSDDPRAFFVLVNTEGSNALPAETRPQWLAAESAKLFLGAQLQCAECHDHPFTSSWKQDDFWGLAAFFGQLRIEKQQQQGTRWYETPVALGAPAEIVVPSTALKSIGKANPARLLGDRQTFQPNGQEPLRHSLAHWMTSPDNGLFARAGANRLWDHFFGRGLVDPVDDLRPDNPASHPAILQLLAQEFARSQFDQRHLIRCICLSQTYQRASLTSEDSSQQELLYGRQAVRVMSAGVLYDSLQRVTGWPELNLAIAGRTVVRDLTPRETFVEFYSGSRGLVVDPLEYRHGLPQALKLLNAAQLNHPAPTVTRLMQTGLTQEQLIEQLYLTALTRRPTAEETKITLNYLAKQAASNSEESYGAILWALINGGEFLLNH